MESKGTVWISTSSMAGGTGGEIFSTDRRIRAGVKYSNILGKLGWSVENTTGEVSHLGNVYGSIKKSDAFLGLAYATIADIFWASSLGVAYSTEDPNVNEKPTVVLNPSKMPARFGKWDLYINLMDHLHLQGTAKLHPSEFIFQAENIGEAIELLNKKGINNQNILKNTHVGTETPSHWKHDGDTGRPMPDHTVCVFCSASTKNDQILKAAYNLGSSIADNGWGLITGAGWKGAMKEVVKGAQYRDYHDEDKFIKPVPGWTGGSNLERIIKIEGIPKQLDKFWKKDDIYTRMEVMIGNSDAFMIMPGGVGTVQETAAVLQSKKIGYELTQYKDNPLMQKDLIIVNLKLEGQEKGFWDPLIKLSKSFGFKEGKDFFVANTIEQAIGIVQTRFAEKDRNMELGINVQRTLLSQRGGRSIGI